MKINVAEKHNWPVLYITFLKRCLMRVRLKGFNFTFSVLLWLMFEKFCGCIWNFSTLRTRFYLYSILLRSVWHVPFYFMSHIAMLLLHMWIITHILLWSCRAYFLYFFLRMQAWFYLCQMLSVWVGLILDGYWIRCVQLTSFVSWKSPLLDMHLFSHCLLCELKTIFLWAGL